jgi:hypothetical protein
MASFPLEFAESVARSLEFLRSEYDATSGSDIDARWKLTSKTKEVESSILQHSGEKFVTVRGKMFFPGVEAGSVLDLIRNCAGRTAWDSMLTKGSVEKNYGRLKTSMLPPCSADVIRLIYKGIPPVSSRDLCLLRAYGIDDDGKHWLVAESCEHETVPVDPQHVRAILRECGYMITPVAGGCEVVYISSTDFNGWIPTFVQNILTRQQPATLPDMHRVLVEKLAGA